MKPSDETIPLFTKASLLIKARMHESLPLPFSQCQTLWFIAESTKPNMQDVARNFKITAPSATFLVEELARGGLVTRHANSADRRKIELALTPKGKTTVKRITEKREQVLRRMFQTLPERDQTNLNRILDKIIAAN